jgi:thiosulfate/3-mercaptopyruvate sulfurtransferase
MTVGKIMSKWFISVDALKKCCSSVEVVIIDCRFSLMDVDQGQSLYQQSHIEGAHYLHLDNDLSGTKAQHGGRHPLPDTEALEASLNRMGITKETLVIAYDDSRFAFASRLWWLLRYIGHEKVKVLDGGYQAWCEAGLAISKCLPLSVPLGSIKAKPDPAMTIDINEVKTIPLQPNAVLIDSRERERYLGLKEPIDPIAGHINGAINYPWFELSDDAGRFTGTEVQRQRWYKILDEKQLVVYCGSGITACVNLLALANIGREDARLYNGSWSDWCSYLHITHAELSGDTAKIKKDKVKPHQ